LSSLRARCCPVSMRSRTSKLLLGITLVRVFLANRMAGVRGALARQQLGSRPNGLFRSQPGGQHGSGQLANQKSRSGECPLDFCKHSRRLSEVCWRNFPFRWQETNLATMRAVHNLRVLYFVFGNNLSTVTRHACKCMSSYVFIPSVWGAYHQSNRSQRSNYFSVGDRLAIFRMCQRVRTQRENCLGCALYDLPVSPSIFF